jgi:hypothetical protein
MDVAIVNLAVGTMVGLVMAMFFPAVKQIGAAIALKALSNTIEAPPPSTNLALPSTVTVTEISTETLAGTTIFAHPPDRTILPPPANDTVSVSPPLSSPLSSPVSSADTTSALSLTLSSVFILLALYGLWTLFSRAFTFFRRRFQNHALRPDATLTIQLASPERSMVDTIGKQITGFDNFWSEMNARAWILYCIEASANVDRLEREINGLKSKINRLESDLIDQASDSERGDNDSHSDSDSDSDNDPDSRPERQVSRLKTKADDLKTKADDLELQVSALNGALDGMDVEMDDEKKRNEAALEKERKRHETELRNVKALHHSALFNMNKLNVWDGIEKPDIEELQKRNKELTKEVANGKIDNEKLEKRIKELTDEVANDKIDNKKLEKRIKELSNEVATLRQEKGKAQGSGEDENKDRPDVKGNDNSNDKGDHKGDDDDDDDDDAAPRGPGPSGAPIPNQGVKAPATETTERVADPPQEPARPSTPTTIPDDDDDEDLYGLSPEAQRKRDRIIAAGGYPSIPYPSQHPTTDQYYAKGEAIQEVVDRYKQAPTNTSPPPTTSANEETPDAHVPAPGTEPEEPADNGEHGQPANEDPSQEPDRPTTPPLDFGFDAFPEEWGTLTLSPGTQAIFDEAMGAPGRPSEQTPTDSSTQPTTGTIEETPRGPTIAESVAEEQKEAARVKKVAAEQELEKQAEAARLRLQEAEAAEALKAVEATKQARKEKKAAANAKAKQRYEDAKAERKAAEAQNAAEAKAKQIAAAAAEAEAQADNAKLAAEVKATEEATEAAEAQANQAEAANAQLAAEVKAKQEAANAKLAADAKAKQEEDAKAEQAKLDAATKAAEAEAQQEAEVKKAEAAKKAEDAAHLKKVMDALKETTDAQAKLDAETKAKLDADAVAKEKADAEAKPADDDEEMTKAPPDEELVPDEDNPMTPENQEPLRLVSYPDSDDEVMDMDMDTGGNQQTSANQPVPEDTDMDDAEPDPNNAPFSPDHEMHNAQPAVDTGPQAPSSFYGNSHFQGPAAGSAPNNAPISREEEMQEDPSPPTYGRNTTDAVPQATPSVLFGQTSGTHTFQSFTGFSTYNGPAQGVESSVDTNPPVGGFASTSQSHFDEDGNPRFVPQVNAPSPPQAPDPSPASDPAPLLPRAIAKPRHREPHPGPAAPSLFNTSSFEFNLGGPPANFTSSSMNFGGNPAAVQTTSRQSGPITTFSSNSSARPINPRPNAGSAAPSRNLINTRVDRLNFDFDLSGPPTPSQQPERPATDRVKFTPPEVERTSTAPDDSVEGRRAERARESHAKEKKRTPASKSTPNDRKDQGDPESRFAFVPEMTDAARQDGQGGNFLDAFEKRNMPAGSKPTTAAPTLSSSQAKVPSRKFKSYEDNPLDTMPDLTKRYETILDALREANRLFNRWDQDTDAEEIQHLHQDGSSELNDHWERIRWSTEWLVKPQNREGSTAPDGSHLKLLYHLRSVINEMESYMAELLDPDTGNYGLFIDYFETSLAQVRRMQAAIQDSILDAVARRDGITETESNPAWPTLPDGPVPEPDFQLPPEQAPVCRRTRQYSSLPNRPDPHAARYLTVDQRNQNILRHLRAANSLFSQWSEHTEWDELEPLYQNFDSVLNDAWEDIRDADMFFTRVKDNTDDLLPDFYPLDVLLDMQKEVDNLVNQLVILTNDESCMYDEFEQIFRETLPEARRIQSILDQAVDEKTFAGVEFG